MGVGLLLGFIGVDGSPGILGSIVGLLLAYVLLAPIMLIRWQGGGDVKLMMAAGALEGWRFLLIAFFFYAVASFVLSMFMILLRVVLKRHDDEFFLMRLWTLLSFGVHIDKKSDEKILKTNVKWSPAILAGIFIAILYIRSLK
jgi:Flp pilus assembly protein protease CpaA